MKRLGLLLVGLAAALALLPGSPVHAASLRMAPLEYRTTLQPGQRQKGFVDIYNPSAEKLKVAISVKAFKQIDNKGSLQFYDDAAVAAGIIPDYRQFDLAPHRTMRLFFVVDGATLPPGDVFAALLAAPTVASAAPGVSGAVQLGTLLSIVNGTPGSRQAQITGLKLPFWQVGTDGLRGIYTIKNTADPTKTTGFYPKVTIRLSPFTHEGHARSGLVYAGRSRTESFTLHASRLGFYKLSVGYGTSQRSQWVFMATGWWTWVLAGIGLAVIAALVVWWWLARQRRRPAALSGNSR